MLYEPENVYMVLSENTVSITYLSLLATWSQKTESVWIWVLQAPLDLFWENEERDKEINWFFKSKQ